MIEIQSSDMRFALLVKIVSQSQRDDKTHMVSMLKCVLPDPFTWQQFGFVALNKCVILFSFMSY